MSAQPALDPATVSARTAFPASLRLPAALLLVGQVMYIVITLFHAGGDANDHSHVFAEYARSGSWTLVHLGQLAGMTILLAGLLTAFAALEGNAGTRWAGRIGAASAAVTLALYGALQAVDGVALKRAVDAWASAPDAEKAARFASAEAIRWLEWGVRSHQNLALGLTLLLLAAVVVRSARLPWPLGALVALAGLSHVVQGWVVGSQGFSPVGSAAIVLGHAVNLAWMTWLVAVAWRTRDPEVPVPGR